MRILIVAPGFPASLDEPGLPAIVDLIGRLATEHEIEVVALRHPARGAAYRLAGATVHPLGAGPRAGVLGRAVVLGRGVKAALMVHRRRRVDVFHALWADEAGAVATTVARVVGRPAIVSFMGGELSALADIGYGTALGRGGRWSVRASLRLANELSAGSTQLRDAVSRARPGAAVALLPLGVDMRFFSPRAQGEPEPSGPPTVLFVGSLEPVKDPHLALRVFARIAFGRPDARLILIGDGRLRADLEAAAGQLGLGSSVTFEGHVSRAELPERYRSAVALLVTSRHEAQSMVAVEAAACGLPVVGTAVGVLPDLGDGAFSVAGSDEAALAEALRRVIDEREIAARMSAAGRRVASADYDIENTAEGLVEHYARLSGARSTSAST